MAHICSQERICITQQTKIRYVRRPLFTFDSNGSLEYAAAFFLLGGSLKDAVNVCIKNLGDFQLAVSLARVSEQCNDGPVLKDILTNTVLPFALGLGNRWLGSWAFWMLHRRDLAVRILLVSYLILRTHWNSSDNSLRHPFKTL